MRAKIQWNYNVHFSAVAESGHTVLLDGPADSGGQNLGSRPMELILMGLGGCASFDVVTILRKSRQAVTGCVTEITADRADAVPQVFERIHMRFIVSGTGLDGKKVARAVDLSADKYCSASIMLARGGVKITHDYEVREESAEGSAEGSAEESAEEGAGESGAAIEAKTGTNHDV